MGGTMKGKRILIIDDEADVIAYLTAALEDNGFEVVAAKSAPEGMGILERESFDLVCLDILMPGKTGVSLYHDLLRNPSTRNLPIIIITGVNPSDLLDQLSLPGDLGDSLVEKPVDLKTLLSKIKRKLNPVQKVE